MVKKNRLDDLDYRINLKEIKGSRELEGSVGKKVLLVCKYARPRYTVYGTIDNIDFNLSSNGIVRLFYDLTIKNYFKLPVTIEVGPLDKNRANDIIGLMMKQKKRRAPTRFNSFELYNPNFSLYEVID